MKREISQQDILLIDKKLTGEISDAEKSVFDTKFNENSEFQKEAISRSNALAGLEAIKREALKNELKSIIQDENVSEESTNRSKRFNKWVFVVAAAVIVPLCIFLITFLSNNYPNNKALFSDYFIPLDNLISTRNSDRDLSVRKAMYAYDIQEYDSAIYYLSEISTSDYAVQLYLGISYLAVDRPQEAIVVLETIIDNDQTSNLKSYGQWFLVLAYLSGGEIESCREQLNIIVSEPEHEYYDKARDLLEDL